MGRARKFTGTTSGTVEDEGITAIEELRPSVHVSFLTSTTTICSADHYSSESLFTNVTLNLIYKESFSIQRRATRSSSSRRLV